LARNAISLAAQPPLSYPCSDKLPFNLRTWPGRQTAKIGLNATLVAGTLQLTDRVPRNAQIRDSRKALPAEQVMVNYLFNVTIPWYWSTCGIIEKTKNNYY